MHLTTRNVNTAFYELVHIFHNRDNQIVERSSRNGKVLVVDAPVTITYTHPRERVLFNAARDANPFFHLYESLWMLAGRNDVVPLAYYNSRIAQFSDDGKTFNGAYGYRWRNGPYLGKGTDYPRGRLDQLDTIANHLKADPTSRRAVLQMWNVEDDLMRIGSKTRNVGGPGELCEIELGTPGSKDVCCNLCVMFSLRVSDEIKTIGGLRLPGWDEHQMNYRLDMTVVNRSNDLVWGMLGANYVQFTVLQEYLAACLGVGVGYYHHLTNNLHAYIERYDWKPEAWLNSTENGAWYEQGRFQQEEFQPIPLVKNPEAFEKELPTFVASHYPDHEGWKPQAREWKEPFLMHVAEPMMSAFHLHKNLEYRKKGLALQRCRDIRADDWRVVCEGWLQRRMK